MIANWTYNYRLAPFPDRPWPYDFAEERGMEFVPMMNHPVVDTMMGYKCDMRGEKFPLCTVEELVAGFKSSPMSNSSQFLLGWNEPYSEGHKADKKNITP